MGEYGRELWRGGVESWECDANGHLNVRFYLAKKMQALAGLAAELGMPGVFSRHAEATLVVRDHHIRFLREAHPTDSLTITGGVLDIGETDARLLMVMHHASGEIAAVFQAQVEHVTARELRPFEWPARVKARARDRMVTVPAALAPRSLDVEPAITQASLPRAIELGLRRGALGVVGDEECDAFGRMRPETYLSRISEAIGHVIHDQPIAAHKRDGEGGKSRIGSAVLEYRLLYLDWPRAGDRIDQRSGLSGSDHRFRRLTHWVLDPETGRPWCSAQAVVTTFDLATRKMITFSPQVQAALGALATPGLTY